MEKIITQARQVGLFARGSMLGGSSVTLASLAYYPEFLELTALSLFFVLLGIFLYFRTPKENILLLELADDVLTYTSATNPYYGVGVPYQEETAVNINEITYIEMSERLVKDVGRYIYIRLYFSGKGIKKLWFEVRHEDKLWRIINYLLENNKSIKIIRNEYKEIEERLLKYRDRMLDKVPDNYRVDEFDIKIEFKKEFSDAEWEILLILPFMVFMLIAKSDTRISREEIQAFVAYLKGAQQFKSFLLSELFSDINQKFDELIEKAIVSEPDRVIPRGVGLLKGRLENEELNNFKKGLYEIGESLAGIEQRSKVEQYQLESELRLLKSCLN